MKKILWCILRLSPNYRTSEDANALIRKCIYLIENNPNVKVEIDHYYIRISTQSSVIKLWNCNKFYAWLSKGNVNGRWFDNIQPSRGVMYDFKECLKKHGYNIYKKEAEEIIDTSDIK